MTKYMSKICDKSHEHQQVMGMTECTEIGIPIIWSHWSQHCPKEMLHAMVKVITGKVMENKLNNNFDVLETIFTAVEVNQNIIDMIRRVHINLGHPGKATMMRTMSAAGATLTVIEGTK